MCSPSRPSYVKNLSQNFHLICFKIDYLEFHLKVETPFLSTKVKAWDLQRTIIFHHMNIIYNTNLHCTTITAASHLGPFRRNGPSFNGPIIVKKMESFPVFIIYPALTCKERSLLDFLYKTLMHWLWNTVETIKI